MTRGRSMGMLRPPYEGGTGGAGRVPRQPLAHQVALSSHTAGGSVLHGPVHWPNSCYHTNAKGHTDTTSATYPCFFSSYWEISLNFIIVLRWKNIGFRFRCAFFKEPLGLLGMTLIRLFTNISIVSVIWCTVCPRNTYFKGNALWMHVVASIALSALY